MAKDKDKSLNPAAAQRKLEKQKALKKGKAQVAAQRTARFAARNPNRLETQITDLRALRDSQNGQLSSRDKQQLEDLERDVARIKKARESLGDAAPQFGRNREEQNERRENQGHGHGPDRRDGRANYRGLGKRGRDGHRINSAGEDSETTDEEVRKIPWPRDTPPPLPHRHRRDQHRHGSNANTEPLGKDRKGIGKGDQGDGDDDENFMPDTSLPSKPQAAARTTYESKPQVRDLRKEATARFMPQAVKRKVDAAKGTGGKLLEEEELQKLEQAGYGGDVSKDSGRNTDSRDKSGGKQPDQTIDNEDDALRRLREEEEAFRKEMQTAEEDEAASSKDRQEQHQQRARLVQVEEVSDEDA